MSNREEALKLEVKFWDQIASGTFPNKQWCEAFRPRVAGLRPMPAYLVKYLDGPQGKVEVLDVGAGPHTTLGRCSDPKKKVVVTAVDPLADAYTNILQKYELKPENPTVFGHAEALSAQFPERAFDLVYSRNALDHVEDPKRAVEEMMAVCRSGGVVFFEGSINEGVKQRYQQLHQWNFLPCEGDLIIWTNEDAWSLTRFVGARGAVKAWRNGEWYKVEITKQSH